MLKIYGMGGWVVAHVILVSAQVLLVLTLGLWTSDLGLTIHIVKCHESSRLLNFSSINCLSNKYFSINRVDPFYLGLSFYFSILVSLG